ncbi:ricin-type beta-trefoil lectin domain protein [Streptomyces hirsutus]|uniref:ricin-type beta-trefoil lectin domain protein n=1 Tax=Streptomyces hirsutus TaxID=35620 RepID=UPI003412B3F7
MNHVDAPRNSGRRRPRAALVALCGVLALTPAGGSSPPAGRAGNPRAEGLDDVAERKGCPRTVVGVAHEDDDLLFISPRVVRLAERKCPVQVVYVTAGNDRRSAGAGSFAARREVGAQHAYARLARGAKGWTPDPLRVGPERIPSHTLRSPGGEIRLSGVSVHPCDGSASQSWEFAPDGAVRPTGSTRCLTGGPGIGLGACSGGTQQTWRRDGQGRMAAGGRCLTQDDMAGTTPRLHMSACTPYRPEVVWRW